MTRHVNHRGWIVLTSISSADLSLCVDFFERPEGGYGFEHLRADPEDAGHWTAIGGFSSTEYPSAQEAALAAPQAVSWLKEGRALDSWERWWSEIQPQ